MLDLLPDSRIVILASSLEDLIFQYVDIDECKDALELSCATVTSSDPVPDFHPHLQFHMVSFYTKDNACYIRLLLAVWSVVTISNATFKGCRGAGTK